MNALLILLFLFFIIFIPVPLKLTFYYNDKFYSLKIYSFCIVSSNKIHNHNLKFNFNFTNLKMFLSSANKHRYKPILKAKITLEYSLTDALYVSLIYGILQNLYMPFCSFLSLLFNIKDLKTNIIPRFENKLLVKLNFSSIIFVSLAQFIYISISMKDFFKEGIPNNRK